MFLDIYETFTCRYTNADMVTRTVQKSRYSSDSDNHGTGLFHGFIHVH